MNIIDWLIIVILLLAVLNGFRQGLLNSVVTLVGSIIIFVLAFYLKNPVSSLMYQHLPFFSLGGKFAGITVFNILIYEAISYLVTIVILATILKVITKVTGAVNGLVNATLVLGGPSKILGAIFGALEGYIIAFIIVFILGLFSMTATKVNESTYANIILKKTPVLSKVVGDTYNTFTEIYKISDAYKKSTNKDQANLKSLDVLLKYEILSPNGADKLINTGKLETPGAKEIVDKYREG